VAEGAGRRSDHRSGEGQEEDRYPGSGGGQILTVIGPANTDYLSIINRSKVFEVVPLDAKAAVELAFRNRDVFGKRDKKNDAQPYQKVKVDRQILAICRVTVATRVYTDDKSLIECAKLCGIATMRPCDLPIPETARQHKLDLEPHEDLPETEDDEADDSGEAEA
jgi:hypothetical protein